MQLSKVKISAVVCARLQRKKRDAIEKKTQVNDL